MIIISNTSLKFVLKKIWHDFKFELICGGIALLIFIPAWLIFLFLYEQPPSGPINQALNFYGYVIYFAVLFIVAIIGESIIRIKAKERNEKIELWKNYKLECLCIGILTVLYVPSCIGFILTFYQILLDPTYQLFDLCRNIMSIVALLFIVFIAIIAYRDNARTKKRTEQKEQKGLLEQKEKPRLVS